MPEEIVIIECQKCGREVGRLSDFKGRQMLIVNGIATTFWRGVCVNCGREFLGHGHESSGGVDLPEGVKQVVICGLSIVY